MLLTGGVPVVIGLFHLFASHHGGFYMPITYATLLFGGSVLVWHAIASERSDVSVGRVRSDSVLSMLTLLSTGRLDESSA